MSYLDHALVENHNGLVAAAMVTHADGYAERDAALLMLAEKQQGRIRHHVAIDRGLRQQKFRKCSAGIEVTLDITKNNKSCASNLDRRTMRQPGYVISLKVGNSSSRRASDG